MGIHQDLCSFGCWKLLQDAIQCKFIFRGGTPEQTTFCEETSSGQYISLCPQRFLSLLSRKHGMEISRLIFLGYVRNIWSTDNAIVDRNQER